MDRCRKCGSANDGGGRFCSYCGEPLRPEPGYRQYHDEDAGGGYSGYGGYDQADINDNKAICILCYFNILLLIPLLARPNSPYVKFHANQGIILLIATLITGLVRRVPIVGWLAAWVLGLFTGICVIIGVINTLSGRAAELPAIGGIKILN